MTRLTALLFLAASACASATDEDVLDPEAPRTFFVSPPDVKATIRASLDHDGTTTSGVADLRIQDGTVDFIVDGDAVVLDELTLELADVALPEAIYPGDVVLTDLEVHLPAPVRCADIAWSDVGVASCRTTSDLRLAWNARFGDDLHPLLPQTLPAINLGLRVYREDGHRVLDLELSAAGEVWSYLGVAHLSDPAAFIRTYDDPVVIR